MDKTRGFYPFDVGSIPTRGTTQEGFAQILKTACNSGLFLVRPADCTTYVFQGYFEGDYLGVRTEKEKAG